MWRIGKVSGFLVGAALALFASEASATLFYGTDLAASDFTGSRSIAGGGLVRGGGGAPFTAAQLDWAITSNGDNTLHYHYAIDTNSMNGLSHFIFDLSDNCATQPGYCLSNLSMTGGTLGTLVWGNYDGTNPSNPAMPGLITGLKVNVTTGATDFTFDFDSARAPVWGDFYSKGGNGSSNGFALFNKGLGNHTDATYGASTNYFVAMPDTHDCASNVCGPPPCTGNCCETDCCSADCGPPPPVPEPASIALLGVGLVGAGFVRRRKKRS